MKYMDVGWIMVIRENNKDQTEGAKNLTLVGILTQPLGVVWWPTHSAFATILPPPAIAGKLRRKQIGPGSISTARRSDPVSGCQRLQTVSSVAR